MQRLKLAADGPEFSRLVWGAWQALGSTALASPKGLAGMIDACLEAGITTFDQAAVYGRYQTEAHFGAGLKAWGGDRTKLEIVTKCGILVPNGGWPHARTKHYDTTAAHITESLDRSLQALGVEYVDLLLIHRPDPFMDADDTARGLEVAVKAGKARHVGVSNFSPGQFSLLQSRLSVPLVTNQVQCSLLHAEPLFDGTFDQAQELRRAPMVWSPLGKGRLFTGEDAQAVAVRTALAALGETYDCDIAGVALAWLMAHPVQALPILGTTQPARIAPLARAAGLRLARQDWFALLEAARGAPVP